MALGGPFWQPGKKEGKNGEGLKCRSEEGLLDKLLEEFPAHFDVVGLLLLLHFGGCHQEDGQLQFQKFGEKHAEEQTFLRGELVSIPQGLDGGGTDVALPLLDDFLEFLQKLMRS